uniref:Putative secreted protein n=1 Tax=Rhipicephalus microplus TaxID=6941 RepID=A0A6G5A5A3_RHIMP
MEKQFIIMILLPWWAFGCCRLARGYLVGCHASQRMCRATCTVCLVVGAGSPRISWLYPLPTCFNCHSCVLKSSFQNKLMFGLFTSNTAFRVCIRKGIRRAKIESICNIATMLETWFLMCC